MGERMKDTRREILPTRCAWCGWIRVGTAWQPERRSPGEDRYSHGICPGCRDDYFKAFPDDLPRTDR